MDAGKLDPFQHAVETLVGAAGRAKQTIEGIKHGGRSRFEQRRRGKPRRFDFELELPRRVLQRIVRRVMGTEFGIEIAEDPDPNGFGHGDILN